MRNFLTITSAVLLAGSASAQALNETFETSTTGVFPPSGWTETNNGTGEFWQDTAGNFYGTLVADAACHDYYWNSTNPIDCDDFLISPSMDLSAYGSPELTFDSEVQWVSYMAHSSSAFSNGESNIDVSNDGGVTWTRIWTESASSDGFYPGVTADMAAVANSAAVEMRFHYFGYNAHDWGVDNVVVDNQAPVGPALSVSGSCPGAMSLDGSNMTPGGPVVFAYSLSAGSFTVSGGPCAGLTVAMNAPVQLGTVVADGAGNASFAGNAPANACGVVSVVAVDGATCAASNIGAL